VPDDRLRPPDQPDLTIVIVDYVLGGGLAAILLVYLVIALARPEKF
jgi:K+-transporting ATPase KdpF subunit